MAVNLAAKYSSAVDEIMCRGMLTDKSTNKDYDFVGAQTVKVYSMNTSKMNDYQSTGTNRYGIPEELGDNIQELTLRKKRSFTFTIDKTNAVDSPEGVRDAGKALRRQIDEVVIPEIDSYRLAQMAENAAHFYVTEITKSDAYIHFTTLNAAISEHDMPVNGRIAHVSPKYLALLKQDDNFIKKGDMSQQIMINGLVGEIDGVAVVETPASRLPYGASFIITHPIATPAPVKLAEYKIHENPPGIAGHLVEGLVYYDAFVLNNKKKAIAAGYGHFDKIDISVKAGTSGKIVTINSTRGGNFVYKSGASQAAVNFGADVSSWTALTPGSEIALTAGHKLVVASSVNGKAVASSEAVTV